MTTYYVELHTMPTRESLCIIWIVDVMVMCAWILVSVYYDGAVIINQKITMINGKM